MHTRYTRASPSSSAMLATAHDHQLRSILKSHLSSRVHGHDLLVDELLLAWGAVRADVALVNGHLEGFEIKAGRDTLQRLPAQVLAYNAIFDFSWMVTTKEHLPNVRGIVPTSWGLLVAESSENAVHLLQVRKAKPNKQRSGEHLVRLLWRNEVLGKLDELGLSKGLKSKPKLVLFKALAEAMPVAELSDYVRQCLKARTDWRVAAVPDASKNALVAIGA